MMIPDFQPVLLSPLSEPLSAHYARTIPNPPSPRKRRAEHVSTLLLDNLELFKAPLSNKQPRLQLQLQPTTLKSAMMANALKRLREKAATDTPSPVVPVPTVPVSPRTRRAPTLPRGRSRGGEAPSLAKVERDRTPIRSPPERSNSGLARCA